LLREDWCHRIWDDQLVERHLSYGKRVVKLLLASAEL